MDISYKYNDEWENETEQIWQEVQEEHLQMTPEERAAEEKRLHKEAQAIIDKYENREETVGAALVKTAIADAKIAEFKKLSEKALELAEQLDLNIEIPEPSSRSGKIVLAAKYLMIIENKPEGAKAILNELINKSCDTIMVVEDNRVQMEFIFKFYDAE